MPLYLAPLAEIQSSANWQAKNSNYTAIAGDNLIIDTSATAWILTLPSNPSQGEEINILGANGLTTNYLTINLNGQPLNTATPYITILKQNFQWLKLVYINNTIGWVSSSNLLVYGNQYKTEVLADSPWSYLRLGDTTGTTAIDASGNGHTGTYNNVTLSQPSSLFYDSDYSAAFNGNSSYVSLDNSFSNPNPFSIECRFKTTSLSGGLIGFSNVSGIGGSSYDRELKIQNGQLSFDIYQSGNYYAISSNTYNDGNWHTVTALLGTSGMQLWCDGILVGSNSSGTIPQPYTGYWHLGYSTTGGYFNGLIDEASITLNALSSSRIIARHTAASL